MTAASMSWSSWFLSCGSFNTYIYLFNCPYSIIYYKKMPINNQKDTSLHPDRSLQTIFKHTFSTLNILSQSM